MAAGLPFLTVLSGIGTAVSFVSQISAANQQADEIRRADEARQRSIALEAEQLEASRAEEEADLVREGKLRTSRVLALAGASGFNVNAGSPLLAQEDSLSQIRADIDALNTNVFNQRRRLFQDSSDSSRNAAVSASNRRSSGFLQAGSTLLTGARNVFSAPKSIGPFGDPI